MSIVASTEILVSIVVKVKLTSDVFELFGMVRIKSTGVWGQTLDSLVTS